MKRFLRILLTTVAILLTVITLWNLCVMIFPHTYTFLDAEGKNNRTETRRYLFRIIETRLYIEDTYNSRSISIIIGKFIHTYTYDANGKRIDYQKMKHFE